MGFQFAHIETYSRKSDANGRSVGFVLDEAAREPHACTHVEQPGEPTVVYGVGPREVRALHDDLVAKAGAVDKTGKRRIARVDQHTLLTVIASHPATSEEVRADPALAADVDRWQGLAVAWLRERHGDDLVGVVRHDDESHPHLHVYVLPRSLESMKAKGLHPGVVAKEQAVAAARAAGDDAKTANKRGDRAYKAAMREWQDSYWHAVGLPCGQTRVGPGKRSLSKASWQAEQAHAEQVGVLVRTAAAAQAEVDVVAGRRAEVDALAEHAAAAVAEAKNEAARAKAEADALVAAARVEAARLVAGARRQADGIISKARQQATRLVDDARASARAMGSVLGSVFYGITGQAPSKAEARGAEAVRVEAEARESGLRGEMSELRREVKELRRGLSEARADIRRLAGERDELRAVLDSRLPAGLRPSLAAPPVR